jgi:hypothetical protein
MVCRGMGEIAVAVALGGDRRFAIAHAGLDTIEVGGALREWVSGRTVGVENLLDDIDVEAGEEGNETGEVVVVERVAPAVWLM